jgi:hypothetical protein
MEYTARFYETWCDLKYRDFESAILVGHSLFFRELFGRCLQLGLGLASPSPAPGPSTRRTCM